MDFKHYYNLFTIGGYYGVGVTASGEPITPKAANPVPLQFRELYPYYTTHRFIQIAKHEKSYWRTRDLLEHTFYEDRASTLMIITTRNLNYKEVIPPQPQVPNILDTTHSNSSVTSITDLPSVHPSVQLSIMPGDVSSLRSEVKVTENVTFPDLNLQQSQSPTNESAVDPIIIPQKKLDTDIFRTIFIDLELLYREVEAKAAGVSRELGIFKTKDMYYKTDEAIQKAAVDYILARIFPVAEAVDWPRFGEDGYMHAEDRSRTVSIDFNCTCSLDTGYGKERMCKLHKLHQDNYPTLEISPPVHDKVYPPLYNPLPDQVTPDNLFQPLQQVLISSIPFGLNLGPFSPPPRPVETPIVAESPHAAQHHNKRKSRVSKNIHIEVGQLLENQLSPSDVKLPQLSESNANTPKNRLSLLVVKSPNDTPKGNARLSGLFKTPANDNSSPGNNGRPLSRGGRMSLTAKSPNSALPSPKLSGRSSITSSSPPARHSVVGPPHRHSQINIGSQPGSPGTTTHKRSSMVNERNTTRKKSTDNLPALSPHQSGPSSPQGSRLSTLSPRLSMKQSPEHSKQSPKPAVPTQLELPASPNMDKPGKLVSRVSSKLFPHLTDPASPAVKPGIDTIAELPVKISSGVGSPRLSTNKLSLDLSPRTSMKTMSLTDQLSPGTLSTHRSPSVYTSGDDRPPTPRPNDTLEDTHHSPRHSVLPVSPIANAVEVSSTTS